MREKPVIKLIISRYVGSLLCRHLLMADIRTMVIFIVFFCLKVQASESEVNTEMTEKSTDTPANVLFNGDFMHGMSVDVSRYSQGNPNPEGNFPVQIVINGTARGRHKVLFKKSQGNQNPQPCITYAELKTFGIDISTLPEISPRNDNSCRVIEKWIPGSQASYQTGDFVLTLRVPQAYMIEFPRGYTDPDSWDSGVPAALLDYNANIYGQEMTRHYIRSQGHNVSGNAGLLTGLNIADWRLRERFNMSWNEGKGVRTQNLYTYIQRDITKLKSQLTLGDSNTSGELFDSLSVRGVQLQSDDRMLPEGLRYYTPAIRGNAETNAKIRVSQHGRTVYETTVPPGPFEINDVGAMGYGGDLQVTITEADGRVRMQTVPFSAPPMLLHKGITRYGIVAARLQDDTLRSHPDLLQAFYQYGLGNLYTLYGGSQFSKNYGSLGLGQAFNTQVGGIALDIIRARSELKDGRVSVGNSYSLAYSKYLDTTDTNFTLAAYRYSSKGFYSFRDAVTERNGTRNNAYLVDYRTRQRFTANLSQRLWNGAQLNLSGSFYKYWDNRSASNQYILSYNKTERYFSWSLSASRSYDGRGKNVNSLMASVSIPLGRASITRQPAFNTLYTTLTHDDNGATSLQTNAIGSQGAQNELTYGVGTSASKSKHSNTQTAFNGNANYNSAWGQFGSTATMGDSSQQLSLSANGSIVAHRGGLTLGPRLGDYPFAIVDAQGAEGAKLSNGYGARIDSHGYAIVPSLTPYRENSIAVNTTGLPDNVDVLDSESTVIPRMGAAVEVRVKTLVGTPAILIVRDNKGNYLPIGSTLSDEHSANIGIIGQGGMAFVRGWQADKTAISVKDASGKSQCTLYPDAALAKKISAAGKTIARVDVLCR